MQQVSPRIFPKPISHLNTIFYLLQPWFLRAVSAPRIQEVALEAIFSPRVFQIWLEKTCFHPSLLEDKSWQVNASPKFPKTVFDNCISAKKQLTIPFFPRNLFCFWPGKPLGLELSCQNLNLGATQEMPLANRRFSSVGSWQALDR